MFSRRSRVLNFKNALEDFDNARRKAALQAVLSLVSGKSQEMLSYDEVRARLEGVENAYPELRDIPLDAIVGTVSRYADFNRSLLPLNPADDDRWAHIRLAAEKMEGLPPIDVYQIGEAYFIQDGHHRASVARQIGATHIQAYVREVSTRVPVSSTDDAQDIILKSEYNHFLKQTNLDVERPDANLRVTSPGGYDRLLELIGLHRYDMVLELNHAVTVPEAASDWFEREYLPVEKIIRDRKVLRDFPDRTETDFFLWLVDHSRQVEETLGWQVDLQTAAAHVDPTARPGLIRLARSIRKWLRPKADATSAPSRPSDTQWRSLKSGAAERSSLFEHILVSLRAEPERWHALDSALLIAQREGGFVGGLLVQAGTRGFDPEHLKAEFARRCRERQVEGSLAVVPDWEENAIRERLDWADLIVDGLERRKTLALARWLPSEARRFVAQHAATVLFTHVRAESRLESILLAYDGDTDTGPALFLAAYMALHWQLSLTVLVFGSDASREGCSNYLSQYAGLQAHVVAGRGDEVSVVPVEAEAIQCDAIVLGKFKQTTLRGRHAAGIAEQIICATNRPVFICV
ncbi:MAG TPA: hypothetical protein PJ988_01215 [Anaerolinea sp.]|nr:hypothetical protein [Anaerolinea sp.]